MLVTLSVDTKDAPSHCGASVRLDRRILGTVTSAGWGHRTGLNLVYAFMDPAHAAIGTALTVDVIGAPVAAQVIKSGPYDPDYSLMRS